MAHFALVENGIVKEVIVVSNDDCGGGNFPESEPIGQAFLASLGFAGEWLQTSYHGSFRNKFAGKHMQYDAINDIFIDRISEEDTSDTGA